ncbi:MAG: hypothetical protein ACK5MH_00255 [Bacteroidales bacterium]|mgnify:CR=1 FL=1|nr:hypothetical protein [Bacteroidales bacterium]MDD4544430.1 hypothetical protein [Bacteroidales bacterium]
MKHLILVLSLSFLFYSCKDNEGEVVYYDTFIYGNVTDYFSGEPIEGLIIDVEYNDEFQGMGFFPPSTTRVFMEGVSITDQNGYYKIPIAFKVGAGGSNYTDLDKVVIKPRNNLENYYFSEGTFDIYYIYPSGETFYESNQRFDIRARNINDYGFIKIYFNPVDTVSYKCFQVVYSFTEPYLHEFTTLDTIKTSDYYCYVIKVPLLTDKQVNVYKNSYNFELHTFNYTLNNKLDTFSYVLP